MTPENLGNGSGINEDGDVVPIEDVIPDAGFDDELDDDTIEKATDVSRKLVADFGGVASSTIVDHESHHRVYPRTVAEVIADRKRTGIPVEIEINDANAEIGGGVPAHRESAPGMPLRNVLNESTYRPWQKNIRDAVERFGLADFRLAEFQHMKDTKTSEKDFLKFCEQFYDYQQGIMADLHLIEALEDRDISINPDLVHRFGSERTNEELKEYTHLLRVLDDDLEETGIPALVRATVDAPKDPLTNMSRRNKVMHDAKQTRMQFHQGNKVQVVRSKGKLTLEWIHT